MISTFDYETVVFELEENKITEQQEQQIMEQLEELLPEIKTIPSEVTEMRVINRLNDALFKYLFGREESKHLLVAFLNSILDDSRQIESIEYLDRESSPKFEGGKGSRFDVRAKATDGRHFHVEVQIGADSNMFKRAVFYACDTFANQLKSGETHGELMPVILVGVTGYELFDCEDVCSHYLLMETKRLEIGTDALEFYFMELPKLKRSKDVEGKKFYRWLRYLESRKMGDDEEMRMLAQAEPALRDAFAFEERFRSNPELRFRYMKNEVDRMYDAKRDLELLIKGKAEGLAEAARGMIQNMVPLDIVSKSTGFSEAELAKLVKV